MAFTKQQASLGGLKGTETQRKQRLALNLVINQAKAPISQTLDINDQDSRDSTISRAFEAKSESVRALCAIEAVKQAERMARAKGNAPAMFKLLVEAFDKLFGWSRTESPGLVLGVGYLSELGPAPGQVLDITPSQSLETKLNQAQVIDLDQK
jgi:hypothetical protein